MSDYGAVDKELVPGALRGYRTWRPYWGTEGKPIGLRACNFEVTWTPGVNEAECHAGAGGLRLGAGWPEVPLPDLHPAPRKGCSCGFYAVHEPQHVDSRGIVFGSIKAYGSVILGEKGFRAGKAEIEGLAPETVWIANDHWDILKQLGDQYQVPIFPTIDLLMDAFPPISVEHLLGDWRTEKERQQEEARKQRQHWVDEGYFKFTAQVAELEAQFARNRQPPGTPTAVAPPNFNWGWLNDPR